jgi:ferritin-like metal-binding protein YciE
MSATTDEATELFVTGLRNQHAVENQAVSLLSRQVERLENYPEMEARMRQHIDESKAHARRLEELLSKFGESHSALKDAGLSFMGNMAAMAHTIAPDEVLKNTMANFAFEHFEIASYKSLLSLAETLGQSGVDSALRQNLQDEISMAQWIDQHIAPTTLRYLELRRSGATAGV